MSRSRRHSVQFGLTSVFLMLFTSSAFAGRTLNLEEGASCGSGQVCMKISDCFLEGGFMANMKTCSYKDRVAIKCCGPKVTDRAPAIIPGGDLEKTISEKMCEKYAAYVYEPPLGVGTMTGRKPKNENRCAKIAEPLITGGKYAKVREFPHMVQIGYGSTRSPPNSPNAWLCGGSLISERFVLSAAHCTYFEVTHTVGREREYGGLARWAKMGVIDTSRMDRQLQILKIVEWINRTDYSISGYNDIVLFKLETNVNLNPYVRPLCLQVNEYIEADVAIASGWGKISHGYRKLNVPRLRKVPLNILENDECNTVLKNSYYTQGIKDTQLCAQGDKEKEDTCQGDSGGPLQIRLNRPYCMYSLIGVTSGGGKCGSGLPSIYTRVSKYISWIEEHVWPKES